MAGKKKRFDDLMEAVTFAEAGELDTARELAERVFPDDPSAGKRILAVGDDRGFSRRMVEDSLGMAERLGYGIVALTVSPTMARLLARLRARRARAKGTFLAPAAFRARAAERGVPFVHAARGGDPDEAVTLMSRRFRRVAFLVVDPELAARARFAAVDLPIYYLAET